MPVTRINPPLPMRTPKGIGFAHFLIDYGIENDIQWVVCIHETGEIWSFQNPDVRMDTNITYGRVKQDYKWNPQWK